MCVCVPFPVGQDPDSVCVCVPFQGVRQELEDVERDRDSLQSSLVLQTGELSTVQSDLATCQTQLSGAQWEVKWVEREGREAREELDRERESHAQTKQKLSAALKVTIATTVKKWSVMYNVHVHVRTCR